MPKRRVMRRATGRRGLPRGFVITGKTWFPITVANGNTSAVLGVEPQNFSSGVLPNLAKAFKFYRFRALRFSLNPITRFETTTPANSQSNAYQLAYIPDMFTGTPTTFAPSDLAGLQATLSGSCTVVNSNITDNSSLSTGYPGYLLAPGETRQRTLKVPAGILGLGPERMYFTQGSAGGGVTQGYLALALQDAAGGNSVQAYGTVAWTCEFWEPENALTIGVSAPLALPRVDESDRKSDDGDGVRVEKSPPSARAVIVRREPRK